jgi:tRNA U34 5-methylaminomethyl-2-thiouridine-forming methyltransferase MnmC
MRPDLNIVPTADGSLTLFSTRFNAHFHSTHGALQESLHVFIQMGLACVPPNLNPIHVLEVGGGTLFNAWLTQNWLSKNNRTACYHIAEPFPPNLDLMQAFWAINPIGQDWLNFYARQLPLSSNTFSLEHRYAKLEEAELPESEYNLVFFDAFAPSCQPELWTEAIFKKIHHSMAAGGILVTYCAQGQFKRNLKQAGFKVEAIPGPPGKREMTRAQKV